MTTMKPYLVRAVYQWLVDNGDTPYLLVNTQAKHVDVPSEHIKDNRIVLNISPSSVRAFDILDQAITFEARFSGRARSLWVPIAAIEALYGREHGEGMSFEVDLDEDGSAPDPTDSVTQESVEANPGAKVSHLKVVK